MANMAMETRRLLFLHMQTDIVDECRLDTRSLFEYSFGETVFVPGIHYYFRM